MNTDDSTAAARPPHLGARRHGFEPAAELAELRSHAGMCPITTVSGHRSYLVAGHDEVRAVHNCPTLSLAEVPPPPGTATGADPVQLARRNAGMLLGLEGHDHRRLRRMLAGHFTVRAVDALRPRIERIVQSRLGALVGAGAPADLVAGFAMPIPSLVICELLGVPYADRDRYQRRSHRLTSSRLPPRERAALVDESLRYMAGLVAQARRSPGDDLIGVLIREHGGASSDGGVTDDELAGLGTLLLSAGHDTTANAIALSVLALVRFPGQLDLFRTVVREDDGEGVHRAIEELLRFTSVVSAGFPRVALDDTVVGRHVVPAGSLISASLVAANRDPALGENLEVLDLARRPPGHLAFGYGAHHCLGAHLARLELRLALTALVSGLPNLRLVGQPEFRGESFIHGVTRLLVAW